MSDISSLLINEPPRLILPSLACAIGLNEAIVLQQLHFLQGTSQNIRDGHRWVYKTLDEWQEQFPWWSTKTIQRTLAALRDKGLIVTTDQYNRSAADRTLWYRIDYEALNKLATQAAQEQDGDGQDVQASGQDVHVIEEDKMSTSYQIEDLDKESFPPSRFQEDPLVGELAALLGGGSSTLVGRFDALRDEIGDDKIIREAIRVAHKQGARDIRYVAAVARRMAADKNKARQNTEAARALLPPQEAT